MITNPWRAIRSAKRRLTALATPALFQLLTASPAWAGTGAVTAMVMWNGIEDSQHVPVGLYGLSLNNGSLTDPTAAPPALSMHWFYSLYMELVTTPIWLVKNVLSLGWLKYIATPFDYVSHQLFTAMHSPGILAAVAFIATGFIAFDVAIGRLSRACAKLAVAIVLGVVSITVGDHPVSELLGEHGALSLGRDIGVQFATELSGKSVSGDQAVAAMTESLTDHFLRTPTLVQNFGQDLDAPPYSCGQVWSTAITTEPLDKVKDSVAQGCPGGEELHAYAMGDPDSRKAVAWTSIFFAISLFLFFGVLCALIVILALSAVFWGIVAIVALVCGQIPAMPQGLAFKAGLDMLYSFIGMTVMTAILGLYGNLVGAMFSQAGTDLPVAMPLIALLLLASIYAMWRVKKGLVHGRAKVEHALQRFTNHQPIDSKLNTTLENIDPLTAIPKVVGHVGHLTRNTVTTAAKLGIAAVAPEAAPFLGAAEALQSRVSAKTVRANKKKTAPASTEASDTHLADSASDSTTGAISAIQEYRASDPNPADPSAPIPVVDQPVANATATDAPASGTQSQPSPQPEYSRVGDTRSALTAGPAQPAAARWTTAPAEQPPIQSAAPVAASPAAIGFRNRYPHLCGEMTTRGQQCINYADTCPHHSNRPAPSSASRIHPAIRALGTESSTNAESAQPDPLPTLSLPTRR